MGLVILLYALFGFTFSLGKVMVQLAHPLFAVGLRLLISGTILVGYVLLSKKMRCYPQRKDAALYVQIAIFLFICPHILRLWALQTVPTNKAALLFNTGPFFTALFSYFLHKEGLNWWQVFGIFIGFAGTVPILLTGSLGEQLYANWWFISLPELAVIGAIASLSYGLLVVRELVKHRSCPPFLANGVSMLGGGIASLVILGVSPITPLRGSATNFLIVLALLIIISNLICSNLQAILLKTYSPTFLSLASSSSAIFTAIYGYLLFGETVTWHFAATFALLASGLLLYIYGEKQHKSHEFGFRSEV